MLAKRKLPLKDRLHLYETMAQYEQDGKSILELLGNKAKRSYSRKIPNASIIREIFRNIDGRGAKLSSALKDFIPADELVFLELAERRNDSVSIRNMLRAISWITTKKIELRNNIIKASILPFLLFIAFHVIILIFLFLVIPGLSDFLNDTKVSGLPGFVIDSLTPFLTIYFLPISILNVSMVVLLISSMPYLVRFPLRGILDRFLITHLMYKEYVSALLLMTLGKSLMTGTTIIDFFKMYSVNSTPYTKFVSRKILLRLQDGSYSIGECLDIGLINDEDMDKVFDYTESGGDVSESISKIGDQAIESSIKRISSKLVILMWMIIFSIIAIVGMFLFSIVVAGQASMQSQSF